MALATFGGLQSFPGGEQAFGSSLSSSAARGSITFGQKAFLTPSVQSGPSGSFNARALGGNRQSALVASAQALELEQRSIAKGQRYSVPNALPVRKFFRILPLLLFHDACGSLPLTQMIILDILPLLCRKLHGFWAALGRRALYVTCSLPAGRGPWHRSLRQSSRGPLPSIGSQCQRRLPSRKQGEGLH